MFFGQFLSLKAAKALDFFSKDPILPTAFLNFDALFLQTPFHDLVDQLNRQRFFFTGAENFDGGNCFDGEFLAKLISKPRILRRQVISCRTSLV